MADTFTSHASRTEPTSDAQDMYDQAADMPFHMGDSGAADSQGQSSCEAASDATTSTPTEEDAETTSDRPSRSAVRPNTAKVKAELSQMGEVSILRIEHLRAENIELKAETHRLRQELTNLRERNAALERTNFQLDEKLSELNSAEKQIVELTRSIEYHRAGRKAMLQEIRRLQDNLAESEKRFGHSEAQLRGVCQERADRITVMSEELKALQRAKAELEQQVETLLGYRQRAMSCLQQLTEELQRLRKENREKSRRLSEARAILQNIDQRLGESISDLV